MGKYLVVKTTHQVKFQCIFFSLWNYYCNTRLAIQAAEVMRSSQLPGFGLSSNSVARLLTALQFDNHTPFSSPTTSVNNSDLIVGAAILLLQLPKIEL